MPEVLKSIADNQLLFEAVKNVLKKHFTLDDIGTTYDNETLGQIVRARVDGMKKLEAAFKEIESYKTVNQTPEAVNPAR